MAGVTFAVPATARPAPATPRARVGHEFVFESLAAENIATFKETKVKKVVSYPAYCFGNILKNEDNPLRIQPRGRAPDRAAKPARGEKKLTPVASAAAATSAYYVLRPAPSVVTPPSTPDLASR